MLSSLVHFPIKNKLNVEMQLQGSDLNGRRNQVRVTRTKLERNKNEGKEEEIIKMEFKQREREKERKKM